MQGFLCLTLSVACVTAWSQAGGNAARNYTGPALTGFLNRGQANVIWRAPAPFRKSFFGTPVFKEGSDKLIVSDNNGYLYGLSRETGKQLWRTCVGLSGTFPSSPCTGYRFPLEGVSSMEEIWTPTLTVDGSIIIKVPASGPPEPPYGYNDRRSTLFRINAEDGRVLWNRTTGYFNPGNGDSAVIYNLLIHPSGDVIFWQSSASKYFFVRVDYQTGKTVFNVSESNGYSFSYADHLTYIADEDSVWTNARKEGGIVKLSAKDGALLYKFEENILDSMSFPAAPTFDARTGYIHFGRRGKTQVYAFDAVSGAPVWELQFAGSGWPLNAVPCIANGEPSVVWWGDHSSLTAWNEETADLRRPIWGTGVPNPPPPSRTLVGSSDGVILVTYADSIWVFKCDGTLVFKQTVASGGGRSAVENGPAVGYNEIYMNAGGELLKLVPS